MSKILWSFSILLLILLGSSNAASSSTVRKTTKAPSSASADGSDNGGIPTDINFGGYTLSLVSTEVIVVLCVLVVFLAVCIVVVLCCCNNNGKGGFGFNTTSTFNDPFKPPLQQSSKNFSSFNNPGADYVPDRSGFQDKIPATNDEFDQQKLQEQWIAQQHADSMKAKQQPYPAYANNEFADTSQSYNNTNDPYANANANAGHQQQYYSNPYNQQVAPPAVQPNYNEEHNNFGTIIHDATFVDDSISVPNPKPQNYYNNSQLPTVPIQEEPAYFGTVVHDATYIDHNLPMHKASNHNGHNFSSVSHDAEYVSQQQALLRPDSFNTADLAMPTNTLPTSPPPPPPED